MTPDTPPDLPPFDTANLSKGQAQLTARQQAVLAKALAVLVAQGEKGLTTAAIAKAANCSKESLYKWFGDRDGLLAAIISYQASKVGGAATPKALTTPQQLRVALHAFAFDLLNVISGETSIALNRLAIGQESRTGANSAGTRHEGLNNAIPESASLGALLIARGRAPIRARASNLLRAAAQAGLLCFDDIDDATRTLYGLIVGDRHVEALLGATPERSPALLETQAQRATDRFLKLFSRRTST